MEPWQSWAVVIAGGGLAYAYYNSQKKPKVARVRTASVSEQGSAPAKPPKRRDDIKSRKNAAGPGTSDLSGSDAPVVASSSADTTVAGRHDSARKRKAGTKPTGVVAPAPAVKVQHDDAEVEEEEDSNKAWAEQLSNMKKGVTLAPPAGKEGRSKTVRQSAAAAAPKFSSAASSTGADADDDRSPALSPTLHGGDVSDMLEAPAAAPSVLRLTEPSKPLSVKQPRQAKAAESQETKKQRQNRKKVEERRIEREAEERQRQAMLEGQRRTAREARGEPARNGVPLSTSKPPTISAWAADAAARATGAPVGDAPLLDTFDQDAESTASSNGAMNNSTAATSTVATLEPDVPSEHEQMEQALQLSENVSGWATVAKGKKQKKTTAASSGFESSDVPSLPSVPAPVQKRAAAVPAAKKPSAAVNGFSYLDEESGIDAGNHPDDSQWAA